MTSDTPGDPHDSVEEFLRVYARRASEEPTNPQWPHVVEAAGRWKALLAAPQVTQEDVDGMVKHLFHVKDWSSALTDIQMQFRSWARSSGFSILDPYMDKLRDRKSQLRRCSES